MTEEELAAVPPWEEYVCPIHRCLAEELGYDCMETALIAEGMIPPGYGITRLEEAVEGRRGECETCPYHPDSPQVQELEAWRARRAGGVTE